MTETEQMICRISGKLLKNIEQLVDGEGGIELKDYKAVTGALKEIRELGRGEQEGAQDNALVVRFVGELEDMAK